MEGHAEGDSAAAVTVVMFTDYQCPICRAFEVTTDDAMRRHRGRMKLVHRHYPLTAIHAQAFDAAMAAECASTQRKFSDYHHALYDHQDSLGIITWADLAERAGVPDTAKFSECLQRRVVIDLVNRDMNAGRQLRIPGTPSFLVNDSLYIGARSAREMDRLLRGALASAR